MSTILPFGSNTIPIYVYESFSYTISNPAPGTYTLTTSNTPGIPPGYLVNNGSNVVFATSSNGMSIGTEVFTVTARDGSNIVGVSSNTVTVGAGRFLDASGSSYAGSNYTFFKNEPITPIPLVAPFTISTPTSVPAIPPGLTYTSNASNSFSITGTPLVTVPQSNYLFIGKATGSNLGKIVTSQFGIAISNERILVNLSGSPIISPMTVGSAITPLVFTARYPPYPSGGTLRYSWNGLPDGIIVTDLSGNTQTSTTFTPTDPSSTLILRGTPTITAANAFRDAGITSNIVNFVATRTNPLPQLSNSTPITFAFGETVLFDTPSVPTFYNGVALDPSATFFRAQTYFGTASAITNIFSPNLRSDLSINFVASQGRGYLTGTPTSAFTNTYTIRAINSNLFSRDLSVSIVVANDTVTFISPPTPVVDTCYNYVLSRPSSLKLDGYYPSNVQFQAVAASGKPLVFTTSGLTGTGLSLSNVSANVVQIVGIPDTVTPLGTVTVTASAVGTPATASRNIKLAVLNDVITISDVSSSDLVFLQNKAITPIQLSATTLSERPVNSFTSANIPSGLNISTTGFITGTPTNSAPTGSTFTVNASTGFANANKTYVYSTISDNAIIVSTETSVTVDPLFSDLEFFILSYSGAQGTFTSGNTRVVPKQSTSATVTVTSNGIASGDFTGVPVLAKQYRFQLTGNVGTFTESSQVNLDTDTTIYHMVEGLATSNVQSVPSPPYASGSGRPLYGTAKFARASDYPIAFTGVTPSYSYIASGPSSWSDGTVTYTDISLAAHDVAVSSNVAVFAAGTLMSRSTDYGITWSNIPSSNIQTVTPPANATTVGPIWFTTVYQPPSPPPLPPQIIISNIDKPLVTSIATDGNSNWYAMGLAYIKYSVFPPPVFPFAVNFRFIRKSTDNGITWADVSTDLSGTYGPGFTCQNEKLYYNNGRLFFGVGTGQSTNVPGFNFYCDTSDVTTWSTLALPGGYSLGLKDIAFSNSTIVGITETYAGQNPLFISSNNGTTWSMLTTDLSGVDYKSIAYKGGHWVITARDQIIGSGIVYSSSNLSNWIDRTAFLTTVPNNLTAITENGVSWVFAGTSNILGSTVFRTAGAIWDASEGMPSYPTNARILSTLNSPNLNEQVKKLFSYSTSTPKLTASLPFDSSGLAFTSPTQTQYTNWQFIPITDIPVNVSNYWSNNFVYFYQTGLPRGLSLDLDICGIEATISGTSSQYSDAFQRVILFAVVSRSILERYVAVQPLNMRTILPTVQRQQTSAGAWTSLVRQYTVVNAAQNSLNGRALPSTEPPLGEFTRPEPPDVSNASNCVKC